MDAALPGESPEAHALVHPHQGRHCPGPRAHHSFDAVQALLEEKNHLALMDFADPKTGMKAWWCRQKEASMEKELTTETLCSFAWTFRFKRQAGAYWLRYWAAPACETAGTSHSMPTSQVLHARLRCYSFDPWWTKAADPMTRHFLPDGSLLGVPAHEPYWVPDAECW